MGRRKLYHTKEARAAAAAARSAEYYAKNKEKILKARKAKYIPKAPRSPRSRPIGLTDEEKKVKNKAKSKRHYDGFLQGASHPYHSVWRERLVHLNSQVTQALGDESLPNFVDDVALAYIETGFRGPLEDATQPFVKIMESLAEHERGVLNDIGAGAHLGDINKVRNYVRHIIELLEHLVLVALEKETVGGFLEVYQSRDLMHHVLYF